VTEYDVQGFLAFFMVQLQALITQT
jgi:hypothetical protein